MFSYVHTLHPSGLVVRKFLYDMELVGNGVREKPWFILWSNLQSINQG
ncbi:hypothetical protein [Pontibacter mucosus]|nr:hypothetical protein [Pontibacter mucosus]